MQRSDAIVLMGPSGCGKSTVGRALAGQTAWQFIEGDDYHPAANIWKMSEGVPLDDSDRAAWIDALVGAINGRDDDRLIVACSALTPYVRSRLVKECQRAIRFVMLELSPDEMKRRLNTRQGHFMAAGLLDSQIEALTVPDDAATVSADAPVSAVVGEILRKLAC